MGKRRRLLQFGLPARSTFLQMGERFGFDNFISREISIAEVDAYYLICGQPPHPGPPTSCLVWCAFCSSSKHVDVDAHGFHSSPKNHKRVFAVPSEYVREEYTFDGVCLWVPNKQGLGWYVKAPPVRHQVPSNVVSQLNGAVTFICHAAFQRLTTFQDHKHMTTRGGSSGHSGYANIRSTEPTPPAPSSSSESTPATALATLQAELSRVRALQAATQSRLESLQFDKASLESDKATLESQLSAMSQERDDLKSATLSLKTETAAALSTFQSDKAILDAQIISMSRERDDLKSETLSLKTENTALSTKLGVCESERKEASCKLKAARQELQALQQKQRPAPGLAQQATMVKFLSTTNRNKSELAVLPATNTPAQVYKALKITHDPVTGKRINSDNFPDSTYDWPLKDYSVRRLRNIMSGLHYPISQVLRAFHKDCDELLQLYTKSREIHGQAAVSVLQSSALMALPGMKRIIDTYNRATSAVDRRQVLSVLSSLFSYSDLQACSDFEPPISRRAFGEANHHANAWGIACTAPKPVHVSVRISTSTLTQVMAHIKNPVFIQQVAFGSKDITLSDHTTLKIPKLQRRQLRERMWELYEAQHTDEEGYYSGVSRSTYLEAVNLATSCNQKSLAALDNNAVRFGQDNFKRMRELIHHLAAWNPNFMASATQASLLGEVDAIEQFYKYDFESHLSHTDPCASHCCTHAFANLGLKFSNNCPASCGTHTKRCKQCDRLPVFLRSLEVILGPPPQPVCFCPLQYQCTIVSERWLFIIRDYYIYCNIIIEMTAL